MSNDQNRNPQQQETNEQRQNPGQQNQQGQSGDTTRNPPVDPSTDDRGGLATGVDTGDVKPGRTGDANR